MYDLRTRRRAIALRREGFSVSATARAAGVSRATVREWSREPEWALRADERCFVCTGQPCDLPGAYLYLFSQYLGDGHLTTSRRVPVLRVTCAHAYPEIAAEVEQAIRRVSHKSVNTVRKSGCSDKQAVWKHWPCLLPQHGPGRKHDRPIVLTSWQQELIDADPWPLIRGLIHSDGCRVTNRVRVRGRWYSYPRYSFSNRSRDILAIHRTEAVTVS